MIQANIREPTKRLPMKNAFCVISIAILVTAPLISGQRNDIARYPFLVHGDLPVYPALAKSARISGTVHVRVTVENGEVVGYVQPSGHPMLVSATIDNIKSWKFDKTVRTTFATTFIYQLDGESEETKESSNPKLDLELPSLAKITARPPYNQTLY
jgi:TonB family protein